MERWQRVLYLHRLLALGRYPNSMKCAVALEVSGKTLLRDIGWMRDYFGAPICYDEVRRGFFYSDPTFTLPASLMTCSDIVGLLLVRQALEQHRAAPWYGLATHALERVMDSLPQTELVKHEPWVRCIKFEDGQRWQVSRSMWDALCLCVEDRCAARLTLSGGDRTPTEMTLDPSGITVSRDDVVVVGIDRASRTEVRVSLSNIIRVEITDDEFLAESA